jgi:hypothetical protein
MQLGDRALQRLVQDAKAFDADTAVDHVQEKARYKMAKGNKDDELLAVSLSGRAFYEKQTITLETVTIYLMINKSFIQRWLE